MASRTNEREVLALTSFYFVTTKVLLGFSVGSVLTCNWVVLFKTNLFSSVLSVLGGVVGTVTTKFTYQTDQLALCILLCHNFLLTCINLNYSFFLHP